MQLKNWHLSRKQMTLILLSIVYQHVLLSDVSCYTFTNFLPTKFVTRTIQQVLTFAQNIHPYDYVIILKESITIADQCAITLQWRHNGCDSVSNHQPHDCFLNRLFRRRSKKTSKLSVTGLCAGNSPVSGEFPAQRACNAENVSIWWRRYEPKGWSK